VWTVHGCGIVARINGETRMSHRGSAEEKGVRDAPALVAPVLGESEGNSLSLFTHNPLPMWVLDRKTLQFLQVNEAALRSFGRGREDFLQMTATDLHPLEEVSHLRAALGDAGLRERLAGDWHIHKKDGNVIDVEMFLHRMEYAGRAAGLLVAQDITERRALERQRQHAQKFEAFGRLAGSMAHNFNNVIGAILGWAELGEEQAASRPALAGYFQKIHLQCDRVTTMLRQLLASAGRQILEPRRLSLSQTVRDVITLLDNALARDIELQTLLADDLRAVLADPAQIEQVLLNLCSNARDALPHGGRISIETRNTVLSAEDCRHMPGLQPGSFAEIRVTDTGIGMDSATRERIFEPFFTTKGTGKGNGLGLATVYGIVQQHNGSIYVESEPGQGSTFRIFLPVEEAAVSDESRTNALENCGEGKGP
jgi:two-component system, cell cycle sensor histidine kinase and response regulator CckA